MLKEIEENIRKGAQLTEAEYDAIRALRERLADIEDMAEGNRDGIDVESFRSRSSGPSFAIVVGHTSRSPGADGVVPISQNEYPWNKDLAQKIYNRCVASGVEAKIFFRDGIGISGAYRQVAKWGATCVAELHFNSFNGRAHGTETLYDEDVNTGSEAWAQRLQDEMLSALGLHDRGLKERDTGDRGYASVSALDIPSALIEPFFGDNPSEARIGNAKKDELAEAVVNAARSQLATS